MPYIYAAAAKLHKEPKIGDGQCVALVREYAGAPSTAHWREGARVLGNKGIRPGTAIATFDNGRYPNRRTGNHAAFYLSQISDGIWVVDQWPGSAKKHIERRFIRIKKTNRDGSLEDPLQQCCCFLRDRVIS